MSGDSKLRWTGGGWVLPGAGSDTPVIDAHYHIFPRLGSQPQGIPPALRLKFWQYRSREWIDFWRTDTGKHVDERLLESGSHSIADMPDVGFHLTDHGQAEITVDGVTYRMQIYPPSLTNNEATPERMVAEMDLAGVEIGVLQSDHVYGDLNEYYAEAAARYPGRFIALAQIWEPEADDTKRLARLREGFDELGMRGLYFSVEPLSVMPVDRSLNDPAFDALWRLVEERARPVFWFLDDRAGPGGPVHAPGGGAGRVDPAASGGFVRDHPRLGSGRNHPLDRRAGGAAGRAGTAAGARRDADAGQVARLPICRRPEAPARATRPRRCRIAAVGKRQPVRDVAVVHLPAVARLHPCALRLPVGGGEGVDPGRQCRPAVRPGTIGAA